jgi:hypothetical protein
MAYNQKEWLARVDKATTDEEIHALVMELRDRGPTIPEDGPEFSITERRRKSKPSTSTTPEEKTLAG